MLCNKILNMIPFRSSNKVLPKVSDAQSVVSQDDEHVVQVDNKDEVKGPAPDTIVQMVIDRQANDYFGMRCREEILSLKNEQISYIKECITKIFWDSVLKISTLVINGQINRGYKPIGICLTFPGSYCSIHGPTWPLIDEGMWREIVQKQQIFVSTDLKAYIAHTHIPPKGDYDTLKYHNTRYPYCRGSDLKMFNGADCPLCKENGKETDSNSDNIHWYSIMLLPNHCNKSDYDIITNCFHKKYFFKYETIQEICKAANDPKNGDRFCASISFYC